MKVMPKFPNVVQISVPLFVGLILLEILVARLRGSARYETRDTLASLIMGAGSIISGMLVGFIAYQPLLYFWQFRLFDPGLEVGVFVLCFVLNDLRY